MADVECARAFLEEVFRYFPYTEEAMLLGSGQFGCDGRNPRPPTLWPPD